MNDVVSMASRFRGALLGLAAGDALGTTLEFTQPGAFAPIADMVGGGPFGLAPGQWTDDTSMALCLAESLVEQRGFDALDQLQRYTRWWREGYWSSTGTCFDIGNATARALERFVATRSAHCGDPDPRAAGNGSLMRLAPVVLAYRATPEQAVIMAGRSSLTTHAAPTAVDACRCFAAYMLQALEGQPKEVFLATAPDVGPLTPEIAEVVAGSFRHREPPEIRGSGYVVRSLEAALWALWHAEDFRDGALRAANLGDDADTTAAIYGQLAGALWGEEAIPAEWRAKLALREQIASLADRLLTAVGQPGETPRGSRAPI